MQFTPQLVCWVLTQFVSIDNALDPVFTNFGRVSTFLADVGDVLLPPIVTEIHVDLHTFASYREHSCPMYALGDYSLLFNFLSNYDCACLLAITQQTLTVGSCTIVFLHAMA